jgi:hypothetical protein
MTQQELLDKLERMAANWREKPHLSNDYAESQEYGELVRELKDRYSVSVGIEAVGKDSTNYQVVGQ